MQRATRPEGGEDRGFRDGDTSGTDFLATPLAPPTRYAGAIRTWRSTPTRQYFIIPRGRIRGQPARRSLPEFQTMGRSREDDDEDEYEATCESVVRA